MQHTRRGFTLIELLIVVVIIGILAAIAIPKFADTKRKAYISAMKTDLKNLVPAGEGYFSTAGDTYVGFNAVGRGSPQVNLSVGTATAGGWSATATHNALSGVTCEIFVGTANISGLTEGVPGGTACN